MRDIMVAEISATAGDMGDGVVKGSILQSLLEVAFTRAAFITGASGLRKDALTGNVYEAVTIASTTGATLKPFGDNMVAGDALYIRGTQDPCEMFVEIVTPGVYVGDGIEILESLDGKTLVPVADFNDTSNGFRAAAGTTVYRISWAEATSRVAFSPEFGGTEYKYIVVRPKNLGTVTTAPVLGRVWLACAETQQTEINRTTLYNAATTDGDFGAGAATASFLVTENTRTIFGFKGLSTGFDLFIHQSLEAVANRMHEYLASDGTWKEFTNVNDPSNGGRNGPVTLGDGMQEFRVRWTIPTDWTRMPYSFNGTTYTSYFVRIRPRSIVVYRPSRVSWNRVRSRSFGDGLSTGIRSAIGQTITAVHVTIDVPSAADMTIAFSNYLTGASRSVTIPANSQSAYLPFSSPLVIPAAGGFMISYVSGSSIRDVAFHFS